MKTKEKFESRGVVLGNLWGGGTGAYKAKTLKADTKEELIKQATEKLNDGSLDGGMGFESLIGAILDVETIETVEVNGKSFTHSEIEIEFLGDLTEEEQDFLIEAQMNIN